jgi:MFS family permease
MEPPRTKGAAPAAVSASAEAPVTGDLLDGRPAYVLSAGLGLVLVLHSFMTAIIPIVRPELQAAPFSLSSSQIGLLTSVFAFAYCSVGVVMGLAVARWGGRTALVGVGIVLAGLVMFAVTSSFGWFLAARFLQGSGASCAIPVATAMSAHNVTPRLRNRALGIYGSGFGLGTVLALRVMPSIQEAGGYRAVFLALVGVGLVVAAVLAGNRTVRSRPTHSLEDTSFLKLVKALGRLTLSPRMWLMIIINTSAAAGSIALVVAAARTAGVGAAQLVGNPAGAWAMARWGKPLTLLVCLAPLTVFTAVVPLPPGLTAVFVPVLIATFFTMATMPPILGSIPEIVSRPEDIGPAAGLLGITNLVGMALPPWIFGAILDAYGRGPGQRGYLWGYLALALFPLAGTVAGVVYWLLTRKRTGAAPAIRRETLQE